MPNHYRCTLLLMLALLSAAPRAFAQGDVLYISFGSTGGCNVIDDDVTTWTVNVIHHSASMTACRFKIQTGPGMTATYLSETHPFAQSFGNTQVGITVCYDGLCLGGDVLVATMTFQAYGTSEPCSEIQIVPHPSAETVDIIDCAFTPRVAGVENGRAEAGGCGCSLVSMFPGSAGTFGCAPLPVEETTWGRVKALYRK